MQNVWVRLSKCILSLWWKTDSEEAEVMSPRRLFQILGHQQQMTGPQKWLDTTGRCVADWWMMTLYCSLQCFRHEKRPTHHTTLDKKQVQPLSTSDDKV